MGLPYLSEITLGCVISQGWRKQCHPHRLNILNNRLEIPKI